MERARALAPVLVVPLVAGLAFAQAPILNVEGLSAGERLGLAVAAAGDVDGDGIPDLLLGAPNASPRGPASGRALLVSGADGSILRNFAGALAGDSLGCAVAGVGDVDGDGVPDLLIGARGDDVGGSQAGAAFLISGARGNVLWVVRGVAGDNLGCSVVGLGDVNGDGVPDVAVGAWTADSGGTNSGHVRVLDGATGSLLRLFSGEAPYDHFGFALANVGDVDGDGVTDLAVGARWSAFTGYGAGSAYVYSGASGALLHVARGAAAGDAFGSALVGLGDVTGDGVRDLAVGAPGSDVGGANSGSVYVFSGADGGLVRSLHGLAVGDGFGGALAALDIDQDGVLDLAVGALASDERGTNAGSVRVFSGADGSQLASLFGGLPEDRLGSALASLGDVDLDGRSELLVGAYGDSGKGALTGAAKAVSFALAEPVAYCTAAPNSTGVAARIGYRGSVSVSASDLRLVARQVPRLQFGIFYYGTNRSQVPFGNGLRCVGGNVFRMNAVSTGTAGQALYALDLANPTEAAGTIHPGSTWRFQFWFRDPQAGGAGFNFSDALEATFAP